MESGGARVALNVGGDIVAVSEAVVSDEEWTRVEVTYTHPASAQTAVMYPCLQSCGKGYAYFDAVQCEQSANASRYNLIENGDFTWSDLLTSIGGQSLTADEIGNLLSDGTWTYTWQHGRQLAGMSKTGMNIAYGYDSDGKRITKTVNGTTYNYHYLGDQLVELTWGGNKLHFIYDSTGPLSVNYNGTEYFYVKNAQGDVTGLVNASGTRVVTYTYDAWGNPLSTTGSLAATLGAQNPLRYRGYVYDTETGLYYLQSRYYNPGWGRFINADVLISDAQSILGLNIFAYCGNNPINHEDPTGYFASKITGWFKSINRKVNEYFSHSNIFGTIVSGLKGAAEYALTAIKKFPATIKRPANIGSGTFSKQVTQEVARLTGTVSAVSKVLSKAAYGAVAIDVGIGVYENIKNGVPAKKVVLDALVDTAFTASSIWTAGMAGSIVGNIAGTLCPGVGNLVGTAAGFIVGVGIYVVTDMVSFNGKTAREWAKYGVNGS